MDTFKKAIKAFWKDTAPIVHIQLSGLVISSSDGEPHL